MKFHSFFSSTAIFIAFASLQNNFLPAVHAAETAPEDDSGLEEIIVEGQKIERSLQDTKESVAVITSKVLEERGLIDIRDVFAQTASVSGNGRSFRIRGIDSGPIGTLRSELASFYVDDVALTGWVKAEGPQQMWDVAQVEIFRGPQSTNLGRNALAGAIAVKTKAPEYEEQGIIRLGVGNYGRREVSGMVNLPIADDISAVRLSFDRRDSDGFVENITRNEDSYAYETRQNLRLKWLLEPSEKLRILASFQYVDNDYGDNSQAFEASGYDREDRIALADVRGAYPLTAVIASLVVDYEINDQWHLKSISAYMDGERNRTDDFDDSAANGGYVYREGEDRNYSQEFRLNYTSDKLQGSSGLYYSNVKADNMNQSVVNLFLRDYGADALIDLGIYPEIYDLQTGGVSQIKEDTYAFFTEWEYDFAENWTVSAGARYHRQEQGISFQATGGSSVTLPNPADYAAFGLEDIITFFNYQLETLSTTGPQFTPDTSFDAFLPHLGITYAWSDDVSTSLFASRGFRAGGTEITGLNNINDYGSEYLTNIEFSLRARLFEGKGTLNANIYYGDWRDQQVLVPEIPDSDVFVKIENAGKSKIYGIEADFSYQFSDTVSVFASGAYNGTEFVEFVSSTGEDYSGNRFSNAPEWTFATGTNMMFDNGLFANANVTYESETFTTEANTVPLDDRFIANLRGGYDAEQWRLEAYVTNLFDTQYPTNIFGQIDANGDREWGRMGAPREFGVRLTMIFN